MPPCEPLTTTAPAASGPIRVMLSAVRIGGSAGTCPSPKVAIAIMRREATAGQAAFPAVRENFGENDRMSARTGQFFARYHGFRDPLGRLSDALAGEF